MDGLQFDPPSGLGPEEGEDEAAGKMDQIVDQGEGHSAKPIPGESSNEVRLRSFPHEMGLESILRVAAGSDENIRKDFPQKMGFLADGILRQSGIRLPFAGPPPDDFIEAPPQEPFHGRR